MKKLVRYLRGREVARLFYARRKELAIRWMIEVSRKSGMDYMDSARLAIPKFGLRK